VDPQAETAPFHEGGPTRTGKLPEGLGTELREPFRGRSLGGYELLAVLGRGGMGVVYKARQVSINRIVAVKMIRSGQFAGDEDLQRFSTEARSAGRLGHPGIVTVHQFGEFEGHLYYSMDYVEGTTLAALAGDAEVTGQRAAAYLAEVADAIQHAHDNGILHRDLKPANVLIDKNDRPLVTDFGLAKLMNEDSELTKSGAALGTPGYMPPEQAAGRAEEMGPASDVYSLGAILYALLTGDPPFRGDTVLETIMQVLHADPPSPRASNPRVDSDLETICLKCLQKDPGKRYGSARELADDLRRYLAGEPVRARPAGWLRKTANWSAQVPLIAALIGRRVHSPSRWHQRANWALLALPLLMLAALGLVGQYRQHVLPHHLKIASAKRGGEYHSFCQALAEDWRNHTHRTAQVTLSAGSRENVELLSSRAAHVALLQAGTVGAEPIDVVAPLYDDLVHVVVRQDRGLHELQDLAGRRVSLGERGSGMQVSARKVLNAFGVDPGTLQNNEVHFTQLEHDPDLDAALVTTGLANDDLRRLLASGEFRLLPIPAGHRLSPAVYHPAVIPRGLYRQEGELSEAIPPADLPTVATTTFLAVHERASYRLVRELLRTLYEDSHLVTEFNLIPPREAAEWRVFDFHPAAKQYFQQAVGM
jgi:TRAP transporter TAXI family solute receptor